MSRLSLRSPGRPATDPARRSPGRLRPGRHRLLRLQELPRPARIALVALGWLVAATALFFCYLHLSRTVPANADGASIALQAWSMLHGNLLLHGWILSDVSFYTTELPQYMLIESVRGLNPDDMHIAGALTYTLLVVLAAFVAKGRASGREGLLRAGLAAGIMVAPPQGSVYVLMLEPDHVGSVVPVLLLVLVLDRAGRRWFVPLLAFLLLTWALVADQVILITAVLPLALVAVAHGYRRVLAPRQADGQLPGGGTTPRTSRSRPTGGPASWFRVVPWFEVALLAAAVAADITAGRIVAVIREHGGYHVYPVNNQLSYFDALPHNALVTIQGILVLFGANFAGKQVGGLAAIGLLHLVAAGLVAWAVCAALRRFGRLAISLQLLTASVCVSVAAYLLGPNAFDARSSREFAAVLPLGAALAGRMLAGRLLAGRPRRVRLMPAFAAVLAIYLGGLVFYATRPAVPAANQTLASWLASHRLHEGVATDYWVANSTTVDSGGQVAVRQVMVAGAGLQPNPWEIDLHWYSPGASVANFAVLDSSAPVSWRQTPDGGAFVHVFGRPARVYALPGYTVLVWDRNLLTGLG
jgi:hypothetical protein